MAPNDTLIDQVIWEIEHKLKLKIEDQGYPKDYVGVNIRKIDENTMELSGELFFLSGPV